MPHNAIRLQLLPRMPAHIAPAAPALCTLAGMALAQLNSNLLFPCDWCACCSYATRRSALPACVQQQASPQQASPSAALHPALMPCSLCQAATLYASCPTCTSEPLQQHGCSLFRGLQSSVALGIPGMQQQGQCAVMWFTADPWPPCCTPSTTQANHFGVRCMHATSTHICLLPAAVAQVVVQQCAPAACGHPAQTEGCPAPRPAAVGGGQPCD
jgi:hypothetical protein